MDQCPSPAERASCCAASRTGSRPTRGHGLSIIRGVTCRFLFLVQQPWVLADHPRFVSLPSTALVHPLQHSIVANPHVVAPKNPLNGRARAGTACCRESGWRLAQSCMQVPQAPESDQQSNCLRSWPAACKADWYFVRAVWAIGRQV
jgi:hypothetical protein